MRLVVEVLSSSSTREFNLFGRLDEYKGVPGLDHVLLVEPNAPDVMLLRRTGQDWRGERVTGLDRTVDLPGIGAALSLSDVYEGLAFEPYPKLVAG